MTFCVLAIFRNEAMNLNEWISHYFTQGASKLYLINNGSTDNYKEIIDQYGDKILLFEKHERYKQDEHYNDAYSYIKKNEYLPEWMFVVDLDEFVFCSETTILNKLKEIPDYMDEIFISEQPFGSSNLVKHPINKIREQFIYRQSKKISNKTMFRCNKVKIGELGIHCTISGLTQYDGNELFKLNHYLIQSREFFENIVMKRGCAKYSWYYKNWSYFEKHDAASNVLDTELSNMVINNLA